MPSVTHVGNVELIGSNILKSTKLGFNEGRDRLNTESLTNEIADFL